MVDIDRSVKTYYDDKCLTDEKLQHLLTFHDESDLGEGLKANDITSGTDSSWLRNALTLAAGLVLAVMVFFFSDWTGSSITERIAQEIFMNHSKALAVEYQTGSYQVLSGAMDKLDFDLLAPHLLADKKLTLLGARYCSIQGQLAAQLKLVDNSGRIYTLYQTRLNDEFKNIKNDELKRDQVNIRLWGEQQIFYGLADES